MQLIGVKIERANLLRSEQHVYAHISVLWFCVCVFVPQVFTGLYSIDGNCLWWLFCTENHHSHRHLKDNDALWWIQAKTRDCVHVHVQSVRGASVFLPWHIYACHTVITLPKKFLQINLMRAVVRWRLHDGVRSLYVICRDDGCST